jgi:hypothetical protein
MKTSSVKEMRSMLTAAIESQKATIATFKGDKNPQVVEMRLKAEGKLEAYEATLLALMGDRVLLKLDGQ